MRKKLLAHSEQRLTSFLNHLKPYSVLGLLATVVLLFGFQAETLLQKPLVIGMIAVPILIQSVLMFTLAYLIEPLKDRREQMKKYILTYNFDDVIATRKLEEWLRKMAAA